MVSAGVNTRNDIDSIQLLEHKCQGCGSEFTCWNYPVRCIECYQVFCAAGCIDFDGRCPRCTRYETPPDTDPEDSQAINLDDVTVRERFIFC